MGGEGVDSARINVVLQGQKPSWTKVEGRRRGSEAVGYQRTRSDEEVEEDRRPVEVDGG